MNMIYNYVRIPPPSLSLSVFVSFSLGQMLIKISRERHALYNLPDSFIETLFLK